MGGEYTPENAVRLTAEEHYVAHLLLVKIYPNHKGLIWSAMCMTGGNKRQQRSGNKVYGWMRRKFAEQISKQTKGRVTPPEVRAKQSLARMGKKNPHSAATKLKMSASAKGKPKSAAHCAALAAAKLGTKRGPHSEEAKAKIRASNIIAAKSVNKDFTQDPAYKLRQAEKMKEIWRKRRAGEVAMPRVSHSPKGV